MSKPNFSQALHYTIVYPSTRVTSSFAGYTPSGNNSHVAIFDGKQTHYLCGLAAQDGNLTWPQVSRSNISCQRCYVAARQRGAQVGGAVLA